VTEKRPRLTAALIVTIPLVLGASVWAYRFVERWAGIDFYQFWAGAQIARRADVANLYSMETRRNAAGEFLLAAQTEQRSDKMVLAARARREFEFFSTPFLYACFGVFSSRYETAYTTYAILMIACAVGALLLLSRMASLSWAQACLLIAFTLVLWEPMKSDLRVSNVNSIQLLAVALALASPPLLRGAIFGALVMFKPNTIFVVPALLVYRIVSKDYRRLAQEAAGAMIGVAGAFAIGSIYFRSPRAWTQWLTAARELASNARPFDEGNFAPLRALTENLGTPMAWALMLLVLGGTAYLLWSYARRGDRDATMITTGLALVLYVVTASLVWLHYFVLALPLIVALMGEPGAIGRRITAVAGFAFMAGTMWRPATLAGEARLYWFGLVVVAAALAWRLLERPPQPARVRRK
jgi:hypothetical protein